MARAGTSRPRAHPVTRPWSGGPGTLFSWEVAGPDGSACGISGTELGARGAVAEELLRRGGVGVVQMCELGPGTREPDQYAYGAVVAWAEVAGDTVVWTAP